MSQSPWMALGTVFLCVVFAFFINALLKKRRDGTAFLNRDVVSIKLYERMLAVLAARGVTKEPGATPLEFSVRIHLEYEAAGPLVQELTALYYRVRFGHESLSSYDIQQAEELLTQLTYVTR